MIKVLVVDDSHFFRKRITECLNSDTDIEVIGEAIDGRDAIVKTKELKPDVVTMDIEMPNMDGIKAVKKIMQEYPLPILMFSSLTKKGATATLDALNAGAADFLTKEFKTISFDKDVVIEQLCERVRALAKSSPSLSPVRRSTSDINASRNTYSPRLSAKDISLAVIGASTGGPLAIEKVLLQLPTSFDIPIVLIQHMPASFTLAFAERLDRICSIKIKQATHGERLNAGTVYLAPGGKQTYVRRNGKGAYIEIGDAPTQVTYKPCVDITFNSIANTFNNKVLAIVLTGMGSDGCAGAGFLKQKGATIWVQNEETCVVYGMPMAIVKANLADSVLPLDVIGQKLARIN